MKNSSYVVSGFFRSYFSLMDILHPCGLKRMVLSTFLELFDLWVPSVSHFDPLNWLSVCMCVCVYV